MEEKIIYITSGRGPAECMWVVAKVLREIMDEAKKFGLAAETLHRIPGDQAQTLVSCSVLVKGVNLTEFINSWTGSILWIGKSPYRKFHKRKNWFVEVSSGDLQSKEGIDLSEIDFQSTRSSGPGGQHVNKTESAIRATHKPSGLQVFVQDSRSQHQNKKLAIERLNNLYSKYQFGELQERMNEEWKDKISVQRGNPSRIYEGEKFNNKKLKI